MYHFLVLDVGRRLPKQRTGQDWYLRQSTHSYSLVLHSLQKGRTTDTAYRLRLASRTDYA